MVMCKHLLGESIHPPTLHLFMYLLSNKYASGPMPGS